MPKRILLIDPDESFTQGLAAAATAAGFRASTASDSEQGMALARQDNPDLIVVCVEAQPTNGYMLCTRLKKDDRLKHIPVILTSANATPDSFEKHKKLKTRAEDYLIKPFAPHAMLQKAAELLGMPAPDDGDGAPANGDESLGLGDLVEGEDEPIQLGESEAAEAHGAAEEAIDVEELEELVEIDEEVEPASERSGGDEDLAMFDQAFDALKPTNGAAPEKHGARPAAQAKTRSTQPARQPTELTAPSDDEMLGLTDDAELAIESEPAVPEPPRAADRPRDRGVGHELSLEDNLTAAVFPFMKIFPAEFCIRRAREEGRIQPQSLIVETSSGNMALGLALVCNLSGYKLTIVSDYACDGFLRRRLEDLGARVEIVSGPAVQGGYQRARLDRLAEICAGTPDHCWINQYDNPGNPGAYSFLAAQLVEQAQAAAKQNEQRAIKAYQKMKGDEKLREKTRKALQIALALLDNVSLDVDAESEKESA